MSGTLYGLGVGPGDPELVRISVQQLNQELGHAPSVPEVIRRIVVLRQGLDRAELASR